MSEDIWTLMMNGSHKLYIHIIHLNTVNGTQLGNVCDDKTK